MKIIEQGHCGGSEQKEGKWPWRHNIGKTTELTQHAHVSTKNRHAHIPSERQLWETQPLESVLLQRLQADSTGLLPKGIPWTMPLLRHGGDSQVPDEYFINVPQTCGQDFESCKDLIIQTKICGKSRPKEYKQPSSSWRGNIRFLPVWQRWRTKLSDTRRGFRKLSKYPLYHHCTPYAGTRQAPAIYQHKKERIHNLILRGGGEWRNRKLYKWEEWERERERPRDEGRKIASKLVWMKDSEGEKREGCKVKNGEILTPNLCKAFKILQLPRF